MVDDTAPGCSAKRYAGGRLILERLSTSSLRTAAPAYSCDSPRRMPEHMQSHAAVTSGGRLSPATLLAVGLADANRSKTGFEAAPFQYSQRLPFGRVVLAVLVVAAAGLYLWGRSDAV
jgi:hypothetical protein